MIVEKERKDAEKGELKRQKAEQRALEAAKKEEERAEELKRKEINKTVEKAVKEQNKKNDKFRLQFKKEINIELRKNRSEANSILLQYFDDEEEVRVLFVFMMILYGFYYSLSIVNVGLLL